MIDLITLIYRPESMPAPAGGLVVVHFLKSIGFRPGKHYLNTNRIYHFVESRACTAPPAGSNIRVCAAP
jgi:hypothetical protein